MESNYYHPPVLLPCGQPKWCATAEHSFPHASRTHQQILHWPLHFKSRQDSRFAGKFQMSISSMSLQVFFCYNWGGRNPSTLDLPEWHHVEKPNLYAASPNVGRSSFWGKPHLEDIQDIENIWIDTYSQYPPTNESFTGVLHLGLLPIAWSHWNSSSVGAWKKPHVFT